MRMTDTDRSKISEVPESTASSLPVGGPTEEIGTSEVFGFESALRVPAFAERSEYVPDIDPAYCFHRETTLAILSGFMHNRRVLIQGYHGTGKSTHIEQVAARLNWPCVRLNLDSNVTRVDLIGKDAIVLEQGLQVTRFRPGILAWALERPVALVFDEYDAGRPDVMFVIQQVLELDGRLTLLDQSRVIQPHPNFRLFGTANTVGLGDATGLYFGTQQLNQGQMDRWSIVATLNYLSMEEEVDMVLANVPSRQTEQGRELVSSMVTLAGLTRTAFAAGEIATVMSPRTVITWLQNLEIFDDMILSFQYAFLNKSDPEDRPVIAELFQRCLGEDLPESLASTVTSVP